MDTYAFAVKLDSGSNLFEVFEQVFIGGEKNPEIKLRWKKAFSEGNVTLIKNENIEKISVGSFWDGSNLIFNENELPLQYYDKNHCAIALSNNYVFGTLIIADDVNVKEKFDAAFSSEVIGIDTTDMPEANLGSIWDGTKFIN